MVNGWARMAVAALGVVATVPLLAGCNRNYDFGPYALAFDAEVPVIAVCRSLDITRVLVEEVTPQGGEETVLVASGRSSAVVGTVVSAAAVPAGMRIETAVAANPNEGVAYTLDVNDVSDPELSARFVIPAGGVPSGWWLSPRGELTREPCESAASLDVAGVGAAAGLVLVLAVTRESVV